MYFFKISQRNSLVGKTTPPPPLQRVAIRLAYYALQEIHMLKCLQPSISKPVPSWAPLPPGKTQQHPLQPGTHGIHIRIWCSRCPDPSNPSLITKVLLVKEEERG